MRTTWHVGRHLGRLGKIIISLFILLTMLVWAWRHTPDWWDQWYWGQVDARLSAEQARAARQVPYALNWYAHKVGLDNRWEMYSSLMRGDWTIIAIGVDANGQRVLLPEPLQSSRTLFQRSVVDFREAKYQIHLTRWPSECARYVSYLKRRYPTHNGVKIESIVLNLRFRSYAASTYDAARTGSHFGGDQWEVQFYPPLPPQQGAAQ